MNNSIFLQDLFIYDLSGNHITRTDIKKAHEMNLLTKGNLAAGEFYLIGGFNSILDYLNNYIGVEIIDEYLMHLKSVL